MVKSFTKELISLEKIFDFLNIFSEKIKINKTVQNQIFLAVEEIFTNMVKYNKNSCDKIEISVDWDTELTDLSISLKDFGTEYFSINESIEYDPELPLRKRQPGKLGLFLTKKVMDEVISTHEGGNLKVTLIKHLGKKYV